MHNKNSKQVLDLLKATKNFMNVRDARVEIISPVRKTTIEDGTVHEWCGMLVLFTNEVVCAAVFAYDEMARRIAAELKEGEMVELRLMSIPVHLPSDRQLTYNVILDFSKEGVE